MGAQGRITKSETDQVVRAAVDDALADDSLKLKKTENNLLDLIVEYLGNLAEVSAARRLPSRWIDRTSRVTVSVNGQYIELQSQTYHKQSHSPLVPKHLFIGAPKIDRESRGLDEKIVRHNDQRVALAERRKMLEVKVRALVEGAGTIKRLAHRWPEGEKYWTHLLRDWQAKRQLPVVNVGEVNKLLGIPKEEAGATR